MLPNLTKTENATIPSESKESGSLNVSAFISEITVNGIMSIEFNATMFYDFDFALLNHTLCDIYLVPALQDQAAVNFTWWVVQFEDTTLQI